MNPQDAPPQQVLTLPGAVALSPFRVDKLLASLPRPLAEAITVDTRFVHFAAISAPLSAQETAVLEKLLTYGIGRGLEYYDEPAVRKIVRDAKSNDYRFSSLILGIVNSTPFQMRRSQ